MKANMGQTERTMRIIAGLVIIAMGIYFKAWWGVIGLVPLFTGSISFCPLYKILGLRK